MYLIALAGKGLNSLLGSPLRVCEIGTDEIGWIEFEYRHFLEIVRAVEILTIENRLPCGRIQVRNHRFIEESGEIQVFHGSIEKTN